MPESSPVLCWTFTFVKLNNLGQIVIIHFFFTPAPIFRKDGVNMDTIVSPTNLKRSMGYVRLGTCNVRLRTFH